MGNKPEKPKKGEERFIIKYTQSQAFSEVQIWVDKETGGNYIYMVQGYGAGLTPLIDTDGKPIITPINQE